MSQNVEAKIPQAVAQKLDGYVKRGEFPGEFLLAVLANDLAQACLRADPNAELAGLCRIVLHVSLDVPRAAAGDRRKVEAWIRNGGAEGLEAADGGLPPTPESQADGYREPRDVAESAHDAEFPK